jgi:hypothetical protein
MKPVKLAITSFFSLQAGSITKMKKKYDKNLIIIILTALFSIYQ